MSEERGFRKCKAYKLDPETNMPIVPEGHFWRVKFDNGDYYRDRYSVTVQLRKKHQSFKEWFDCNWFGKSYVVASDRVALSYRDTKVWNSSGFHSPEKVAPEDWVTIVKQAYEGVLAQQEEYLESLEYHAAAKAVIASLAGDYPPKKLEVSK